MATYLFNIPKNVERDAPSAPRFSLSRMSVMLQGPISAQTIDQGLKMASLFSIFNAAPGRIGSTRRRFGRDDRATPRIKSITYRRLYSVLYKYLISQWSQDNAVVNPHHEPTSNSAFYKKTIPHLTGLIRASLSANWTFFGEGRTEVWGTTSSVGFTNISALSACRPVFTAFIVPCPRPPGLRLSIDI